MVAILVIVVVGVMTVSIKNLVTHDSNRAVNPAEETLAPNPVPKSTEEMIAEKIQGMSLDEKIGQMLIVGFDGYYPDEHIQKMLTEHHIGGVNLLKRNIESRMQLKKLTIDLQMLAKTPLLIAVDQEGGDINRINFLTENTAQHDIQNTQHAEQVARTRAKELYRLGITMNFSPVLDYVSDSSSYLYNRTFKKDPETTAMLGNAMVRGYLEGGIVPVIKHFPGYGNAQIDPHKGEVTVNLKKDEIGAYTRSFGEVLRQHSTTPLMVAHIIIPILDSKPATRSSTFLSGILRDGIKFQGVIITDDIEMVSAGKAIGKTAVEAIVAGADIIIVTKTPEKQFEALKALKQAAQEGVLTEDRINESVKRILTLKQK